MKPLSIFNFIRGSGRKVLPLVISVCLSAALLYFLAILESQLVSLNEDTNMSYLTNMSMILGGGSGVSSSEVDRLRDCKSIENLYVTNVWKANYNSVGSAQGILLLLRKQDISPIMKYQNWKLLEGSMPQNGMEIILNKKLAANNKLTVGSIVKYKTKGWDIGEDIRVVGIFDGTALLGLGYGNENGLKPGKRGTSIVAFSDNTTQSDMNLFIENNFGSRYEVLTLQRANKVMDKITGAFSTVKIFMGIVVIIALSALLTNITMIQYTLRSKEFELLHALGFSERYLEVKVFKEIGSSCLLGYAAGIILAIIAGWLINVCVLSEKAMEMQLLQVENMLLVLLVPLIVTVFGLIYPLKMLKFKDII